MVALVLASPLAWYFMNQWLGEFAYHVSIQWWVFAAVSGTAVMVAFLTVSIQAIPSRLSQSD